MDSDKLKAKLQTEFSIAPITPIDPAFPLIFAGSCFSENICTKFNRLGLPAINNPFGTVFNPISIHKGLLKLIENSPLEDWEIIHLNENECTSVYHSGVFRFPNASALRDWFIKQSHLFLAALEKSQTLILTYGSAHVYELIQGNVLVANCHKLPSGLFAKRRLPVAEIEHSMSEFISIISKRFTSLQIIFTVSPVKYLKDGLIENNLSKGSLLLAIDNVLTNFSGFQLNYFPAFEILHDELRDHSFYSADLSHPSEWSVNYIFERFIETSFIKKNIDLIKELQSFERRRNHKVVHAQSLIVWEEELIKIKQYLLEKYPFLQLN